MSTLRLRRLQADYERLKQILKAHPRIKLTDADGDPPQRYELEYRVRGMRQRGDEIAPADRHKVEIVLPIDYPRLPPQCRMLTPVFHPNIAPHAICVGDHWNAGEPIWSIVTRIAEMIAFQSYNIKSPLNGEAARWVEQNVDKLPTDDASFLLSAPSASARSEKPRPAARPTPAAGREIPPPSPPPRVQSSEVAAEPRLIVCPNCQGKLRIPHGRPPRVRCGRCQTVIDLAAEAEN
jgi:ubiquitin-protein ligase